MSSKHRSLLTRSLLASGWIALVGLPIAGCFDAAGDCSRNPNLPCFGSVGSSEGTSGEGASGAGTPSGGGGQGGQGASTSSGATSCDPTSPDFVSAVGCDGVFVVPGATGGSGTEASPFGSLGEALAAADVSSGAKTVFVCATGEALDESVVLGSKARLHGALRCDDWSKATSKTAWTAPTGEIPLRVEGADGASVTGFRIESRDAQGTDLQGNGNSSVAVLVLEGSVVTLSSCELVAGLGSAGAAGTDGPNGPAPGFDSLPDVFTGTNGAGCSSMGNPASSKNYFCPSPDPAGTISLGGSGGEGAPPTVAAQSGASGIPDLGAGAPGAGEPSSGSWSCAANGNGQDGELGGVGSDGGKGAGLGVLTNDGMFLGSRGQDGGWGGVGQGGGGAGGRRNVTGQICDLASERGPGGAGGGVGGCGGAPGLGGGAGGSSLALVSIGAVVTLEATKLTARAGGTGGEGGTGQPGGTGGPGGTAASGDIANVKGCKGGGGGDGGPGGGGGGGRGGHSVAIAYRGAMPVADASTTFQHAVSGAEGGLGGGFDNAGDAGIAVDTQNFDTPGFD
jgi:hypothetical protein